MVCHHQGQNEDMANWLILQPSPLGWSIAGEGSISKRIETILYPSSTALRPKSAKGDIINWPLSLIVYLTNVSLPTTFLRRSHHTWLNTRPNRASPKLNISGRARNHFGRARNNLPSTQVSWKPGTKALDSCEPEGASAALIPMDCSVPQAKDNRAILGLSTIRGADAVVIQGVQKLLTTTL